MGGSWKLSLACTRDEAEAVAACEAEDGAPVLVTSEPDPARPEEWRLDAYFEREPSSEDVARVRALTPSFAGEPELERLGDEDWVTLSQAGLEPIREGPFLVHTRAHAPQVPPGGRALLIEAGQAFGTGHHETTVGCLGMLAALAGKGARFERVIDLGTGTGLLAFAAHHLWPDAAVTATDIDPVAIAVTRENAELNGIAEEALALVVADGAQDEAVARGGPYDLVIANILAGPLIAMAPEIAAIAAPGATVLLAGLLATQFEAVADAYRAVGCAVAERDTRGDWTIVRLRAGEIPAGDLTPGGDRDGWATDC